MRYEIYKRMWRWRWRLVAANHKIIAHGESYSRRIDAVHAVTLVKRSMDAPIDDVFWKVKS